MRVALTFTVVCSLALSEAADEQQEITAALRKAIAAKRRSLPAEIEQAQQRIRSADDPDSTKQAQEDLAALEELQTELESPNGFFVPQVDLPPKDRDWIGKVDTSRGELTVGARAGQGVYLLLWRRNKSDKDSMILYRPEGALKLGEATSLQGVFRVVGKGGSGYWQIDRVSQAQIDAAKAEITGQPQTP